MVRWRSLPQRLGALSGNRDSVALFLTINRASLLNRPCQTMQCPAESRDEDIGLQRSLAVPTSYQWQRASILAALTPGPCQAWLQWAEKKPKTQAAGSKQRLNYPLNMSLSKTIPLRTPRAEETSSFLLLTAAESPDSLFSLLFPQAHALSADCQFRWEK